MKTRVYHIDPLKFTERELFEPAKIIRDGGLVAFPTETVYGLGANALDARAGAAIFEAKGRPHDNPLIVHVAHPMDCALYSRCEEYPVFFEIARRFMPGPITVITPKKKCIPDEITVGLDTVAIRCPSHPVARDLIRLAGVPIAAPSANRSGKPSPTCAQHVLCDMDGRIPCVIDGGESVVGLESTVIALREDGIHLLRPGFITKEMLSELGQKVIVSDAVLSKLKKGQKAESPGMKYRHYAPGAPCTMVDGNDEAVLRFFREKAALGNGILCFDEDLPLIGGDSENVKSLGSRSDLQSQAHRLFDALRAFDRLDLPHIYVRRTRQDDLGLAITNRLLRACAFDILTV